MLGHADPRHWLRDDGENLVDHGWMPVYFVSLMFLIPTFIAMFFTVGIITLLVTLIDSGHGNDTAATILAWGVPLTFIAWATSGLWLPLGAGPYMADGLGARRPTTLELEAYEDAINILGVRKSGIRLPKHFYVLDRNDLNACVVADTLIVNRELLNTGYAEAVIAHELGHLNSMDTRVSIAVNRLGAFARGTHGLRQTRTEMRDEGQSLGCLVGTVVLIIRACSGALPTAMMAPAWADWWRLREYAADDFAAKLGQAEHLANLLEVHGLIYDTPIRRVWASTHSHPPVALRIDRLRQHQTR
jgi:Zn-dependent protease with chaperone function